MVFERALAASSFTAPSHASIHTSRYVREHSIGYGNGDTFLDRSVTLADLFGAAGWATAGKATAGEARVCEIVKSEQVRQKCNKVRNAVVTISIAK